MIIKLKEIKKERRGTANLRWNEKDVIMLRFELEELVIVLYCSFNSWHILQQFAMLGMDLEEAGGANEQGYRKK